MPTGPQGSCFWLGSAPGQHGQEVGLGEEGRSLFLSAPAVSLAVAAFLHCGPSSLQEQSPPLSPVLLMFIAP